MNHPLKISDNEKNFMEKLVKMLDKSPVKYKKSTHRSLKPEDTLEKIKPITKKIGLTRTSNITHLDRLKIPVYTSIRPMAKEGAVSVYAGKGPDDIHAKVSSIMEAVERYSAEIQENEKTIIKKYDPADCIDPETLILPTGLYSKDIEIEWIEGYSIKTGKQIYIPANAVFHPYTTTGVQHLFYSNTNGLSSGNTLEEAIFHGLMEVVERDAWSIFEAQKSTRSRINCNNSTNEYIPELLDKFRSSDVSIELIDLTSDNRIPTIAAVSEDLSLRDPALLTLGVGTHLDANIAAIRAITEVAQSRATQIHGTREDTTRANLLRDTGYETMKRLNKHYFNTDNRTINIEDIPDESKDTFKENIDTTMKLLEKSGVDDAYYVDLTRDINIPAVRVIIPGMESFSVDPSRTGKRLQKHQEQVR